MNLEMSDEVLPYYPMYYPALDGAEVDLKEVSEELLSRGHAVTVVTANLVSHANLWPGNHGDRIGTKVLNGV